TGGVGVGEMVGGAASSAAVGQGGGGVLGHCAIAVRGDDGILVAAGDGDGDGLGGGAAVVVVDFNLVGLDDGLALRQEVDRIVGDREVPGRHAAGAGAGGVGGDGRARGERAELHAARIGRRHEGRTGGVGVGE